MFPHPNKCEIADESKDHDKIQSLNDLWKRLLSFFQETPSNFFLQHHFASEYLHIVSIDFDLSPPRLLVTIAVCEDLSFTVHRGTKEIQSFDLAGIMKSPNGILSMSDFKSLMAYLNNFNSQPHSLEMIADLLDEHVLAEPKISESKRRHLTFLCEQLTLVNCPSTQHSTNHASKRKIAKLTPSSLSLFFNIIYFHWFLSYLHSQYWEIRERWLKPKY